MIFPRFRGQSSNDIRPLPLISRSISPTAFVDTFDLPTIKPILAFSSLFLPIFLRPGPFPTAADTTFLLQLRPKPLLWDLLYIFDALSSGFSTLCVTKLVFSSDAKRL